MAEIPFPDGGAAAPESGAYGAAADPSARPGEGPVGPAGPAGAGLRILVLDDDRTTQRFLRYILEKDGYEVTTAGDGVEALLALGQGSFDLILSDLHMPHLDGLELLAQRTRTGLRVPVVVLSADGSESTVRRCLRLGAADYLRKPVRRDTLLPRVRRALGRGGPDPGAD